MEHERLVFIPNRSFHDFNNATKYGRLVFLTEGVVRRLNVNQLYREFSEAMKDASPDDYILISSLGILNAISASIMAFKFGRVNFLVYDGHDYIVREITLSEQLTRQEPAE